MSFDMMHSDQWLTCSVCDCFCFCNPHQKCTYQPRSVSHSDRIDIIQCYLCFFQCFLDNLINLFDMFSGSDLRNHAAV